MRIFGRMPRGQVHDQHVIVSARLTSSNSQRISFQLGWVAARERALNFCVGKSGASPATLEHTQTTQGEGGRAAVLGEHNAGQGFGGGGSSGGQRW